MTAWTWQLCDASGSALADLTTAAGKTISYRRNAYSEATCTVSHEDDVASLVWGAIDNTGMPTLRCYRNGVLRFNGRLAPFSEQVEETALMTLVFRSPLGGIIGEGTNRGRFTKTSVSYGVNPDPPLDAGVIALNLLDSANSDNPTGLSTADMRGMLATSPPTFPFTKPRDRTYPVGQNVGEAVTNLTAVLDGFDFSEIFQDGRGATLAEFHILASQGVDRPAARFEYGPDTLANVGSMSRTVEPPVNVVTILGGNNMSSTKINQASIDKYGWYSWLESQPDVTEQQTLDDKATALLRPAPVKTVQFVPEYGLENCPRYFDDFDMGDTVRLFARRGPFTEDTLVRLNGIVLTVDENGLEVAEILDPQTPDGELTIKANLITEVLAQ